MNNFELYLKKNDNNIMKTFEELWKIWNDTYWIKNSKKYTTNEIVLFNEFMEYVHETIVYNSLNGLDINENLIPRVILDEFNEIKINNDKKNY